MYNNGYCILQNISLLQNNLWQLCSLILFILRLETIDEDLWYNNRIISSFFLPLA